MDNEALKLPHCQKCEQLPECDRHGNPLECNGCIQSGKWICRWCHPCELYECSGCSLPVCIQCSWTLKNGAIVCQRLDGTMSYCVDAYLKTEMGVQRATGNDWKLDEEPTLKSPHYYKCSGPDCHNRLAMRDCEKCLLKYCSACSKDGTRSGSCVCQSCGQRASSETDPRLAQIAEKLNLDRAFDIDAANLAVESVHEGSYLYHFNDIGNIRLTRASRIALMKIACTNKRSPSLSASDLTRFLSYPAYHQRAKEIHRLRYKMYKAKRDLKAVISKPI